MIVPVLLEDALTVAGGVIILMIAQRPYEGDKPDATQQERNRDQVDEHFHGWTYLSLSALSETVMDEDDMARAAMRGVASPSSATGTAITL